MLLNYRASVVLLVTRRVLSRRRLALWKFSRIVDHLSVLTTSITRGHRRSWFTWADVRSRISHERLLKTLQQMFTATRMANIKEIQSSPLLPDFSRAQLGCNEPSVTSTLCASYEQIGGATAVVRRKLWPRTAFQISRTSWRFPTRLRPDIMSLAVKNSRSVLTEQREFRITRRLCCMMKDLGRVI